MLLVLLDAINREADADIDNRFSYDGKQDQLKKRDRMHLHDVWEEYIYSIHDVQRMYERLTHKAYAYMHVRIKVEQYYSKQPIKL